jgi:hypothetical protein
MKQRREKYHKTEVFADVQVFPLLPFVFLYFEFSSDCMHKYDEMDRACRTIGEKRNVYGLLMGMPDVRG